MENFSENYEKKFFDGAQNVDFGSSKVDGFEQFINKSLHKADGVSVFSMKSCADFFATTSTYVNPLRVLSNQVFSNSDSVEIPSLGTITSAWSKSRTEDVGRAEDKKYEDSIMIKKYERYAKMSVPLKFLSTVEQNAAYVKSLLGAAISDLERSAFISGDGDGCPIGILRNDKIKKQTCKKDKLYDGLLNLLCSLDTRYNNDDAGFILSSTMNRDILGIKDATGRAIFDGINLFGKKVYIMDEVGDTVLFGNFKYGYVICDMEGVELRAQHLFDRPNYIGLSLPTSCGAAVTLPDAIVKLEVTA